jgi:hypothetical protein
MAFLLPPLAPPKKRRGPNKRCKYCGCGGTKGFTKGLEWGEWYHVECLSQFKFVSCAACETVINEYFADESVFDDRLLCRPCYTEEEKEYEAQQERQCIKRDCNREAVEEVNPGHWFCRKHIPEGGYLVVSWGGKYIN